MEMSAEQHFLSPSWHRPDPFSSPMLGGAATQADISPPPEAFYRHHGVDAGSSGHAGYFNSRAAALHGFRSSGLLHFRLFILSPPILPLYPPRSNTVLAFFLLKIIPLRVVLKEKIGDIFAV